MSEEKKIQPGDESTESAELSDKDLDQVAGGLGNPSSVPSGTGSGAGKPDISS